jgi:hypothetical protein
MYSNETGSVIESAGEGFSIVAAEHLIVVAWSQFVMVKK